MRQFAAAHVRRVAVIKWTLDVRPLSSGQFELADLRAGCSWWFPQISFSDQPATAAGGGQAVCVGSSIF